MSGTGVHGSSLINASAAVSIILLVEETGVLFQEILLRAFGVDVDA